MTAPMTGSMIRPSTSSRSIDPAPPPFSVSDSRPEKLIDDVGKQPGR